MFRKIIAITLISILTCSQFGRILGYIGCSVYNITSGYVKCDCEKQFHNAKGNDFQSAPGKYPLKEKTEEIFGPGTVVYPAREACITTCSKMIPAKQYLPTGFHHAVFQPPRAWPHITHLVTDAFILLD